MELGCGAIGLRTSNQDVVNLYFWHIERDGDLFVRHEDYLGRADSSRVKRELLLRMTMYNRHAEQKLLLQTEKLERGLARFDRGSHSPLVVVKERRKPGMRFLVPAASVGARGI